MDGIGTARLFLAVVMAIASVSKFSDLADFRSVLRELRFPSLFIRGAIVVPVVELVIAVCMVVNWMQIVAVSALFALTLAFICVTVHAMRLGGRVQCNCFGGFLPSAFGWQTLMRQLIILLVNSYVLWGFSTSSPWHPEPSEVTYAVVLSVGVLLIAELGSALADAKKLSKRLS